MKSLVFFAKAHSLTTYDALYLEVALNLGLPLSTLDQALQKASKAAGIKLWFSKDN